MACPRVVGVTAIDDFTVRVMFSDGRVCEKDLSEYMDYEVFSQLRQPDFFRSVHVEHNAIVWDKKIDIAPEEFYYYGKILLT